MDGTVGVGWAEQHGHVPEPRRVLRRWSIKLAVALLACAPWSQAAQGAVGSIPSAMAKDWEKHRGDMIQLYAQHTLEVVMSVMRTEHNFDAS